MNVETLSNIIPEFYAKSKPVKALSIIDELISGKYYPYSKLRHSLIQNYKDIVNSTNIKDYSIIKKNVIDLIPVLIAARDLRHISYALLSEIIQYSCTTDFDVYFQYEIEILKRANTNKEKFFYHFTTVAQTRAKLMGQIGNLQSFFISHYLKLSRTKTVNYKYIIDFTTNVRGVDKRAILAYLMKNKPFRNDFIIRTFVSSDEDLQKYAILL